MHVWRPQIAVHVHNSYNAKICILFSKTEFRTFTEGNIDLDFTILAVCSDGPNILIIRHIATSPEDSKYRKIYAIDFASFRPIDPGWPPVISALFPKSVFRLLYL